jgi:uncharacterized protein (TIGR03435 family)
MKKLLILGLFIANTAVAQVKTGDQVPEISFNQMLNAPVKSAKLSSLKGKVVFIEFWATWCSPCVSAMPHLQALQKKFKNQLQVITVTRETDKRVSLFLKAMPANLWFAIDNGNQLDSLFPHRTIPHSVLIDADGKLVANTSPDQVTEEVIAKLLKKEPVNLVAKVDNMSKDFVKDYFFAADTVKSRLMIQPEIKGGPGMSQTHLNNPAFAGRRITMINMTLESMYRMAYGNMPYGRTIDRTEKSKANQSEMFCLDLITETPAQLLPTLQKELLKRFELQAKLTRVVKPVYLLKVEDANKVNGLGKSEKPANGNYGGGAGTFSGDGVVFADIADYLESFAVVNLPVVDDTGVKTNFVIQLVYQPEVPATLTKALSNIGLKLEKSERPIQMLELYR